MTNRSNDMKISHGHAAGKATTEVSETFTGTVLRDPVLSGDGAPTVNSVTFPPSARTNWHTHSNGQILIVTSGRGRAASRDGQSEVLEAGDLVWFSPGEDHWHGAGPDTVMTHLAISLGTTDWGDPVTDADYAAA
jgi:quercetin dioxygenase-like cupin family protein